MLLCVLFMSGGGVGCDTMRSVLRGVDKPTASIRGVKLERLDLQGATLKFDVEVHNPYATPLPLADLDYTLASRGATFLNGQVDVDGSVPARGSRLVSLPATVSFSQLIGVLKGVRPGAVVPYKASLNVAVDAPAVGRLSLPIEKQGELPVPAVPAVELASVQWKRLTLNRAEAALRFKITNHNEFPVKLSTMHYGLALGGVPIADAGVRTSTSFQKGEAETIEVPIAIQPASLGMGAFRILTGKGAGYSLTGRMALDTPFGALNLPFERTGQTVFRR